MTVTTRTATIAALVFFAFGCGGGSAEKKNTTSSKGSNTGKNPSTSDDPRDGIDFHALDFVPYLPGSEGLGSGEVVLIEAGYFDVRQYGVPDAGGNISDYRRATVSAWGGSNAPAAVTGKGCAEGTIFPDASENTLSDAVVEGFYKGALKKDGNQLKTQGEADSEAYDLSGTLAVTAKLGAKSVSLSGRNIPPRGSISFSKALYSIFGTHMDLSDLNETLTNSKRELVFTEDADGASGFNAVVVTAYGSANTYARCIFGPGESATLTNEQFKKLLPLRALTAVFSNVALIKEGSVPVWAATFGGIGIEDLSVP